MAETIVNLPANLDGVELDEDLINEALAALGKQKEQQMKARARRENMTDEEKAEQAMLAKQRRAKVALQVKYAEDNGYLPSKEEINAFIAAQG